MKNFNEKYDRLTTDKTRFKYPLHTNIIDRLTRKIDPYTPTHRYMTPDEINKFRQQQGQKPYSRAEFETFGIDPAGPRRVPLKGYDETSKQDTPKEEPKVEQPKQDTPKQDTPKQDTPKQDTPKEEPKVEQPRPEPTLSQQYQAARAAKNFAKADELGKRIWAKKYSTPDGGSKFKTKGVDVSTGIQNKMFKAIRDDKLDQAVFKRAQRIGAPMEAYDIVLDYLLSEGHADTVEEAHYVMMQMDAKHIQSIIAEN